MDMVTTNMVMEDKDWIKFKNEADKRHISASALMRTLIKRFLQDEIGGKHRLKDQVMNNPLT